MQYKSKISEFYDKVNEYKDVINFTIGDPKETIDEEIKEITIDAIEKGITHYSSNRGEESLIKELIKKEIFYNDNEIYITSGATQGLYEIINILLNKDEGILIGIPTYPNYITLSQYLNLDVQLFQFDSNYQINEQELINKITSKTKAILMNYPHNPTATLYNKKSIQILHKIMFEYNLYLIWDATYYECDIYPTLYDSLLHDQIFQIHSFSKAYKMSGYRIGYNCVPQKYIQKLLTLHRLSQSSISPFIQKAAETALNTKPVSYIEQKKYVINELKKLKMDVIDNNGPFYVYVDIKKYGMDSEIFCYQLLEEVQVGVLPGKYFYEEGTIRLAICISLEMCKEGCERLKKFIKKYENISCK